MTQSREMPESLCVRCKRVVAVELCKKSESVEFRGTTYLTTFEYYKCLTCGLEFDAFGLRDGLTIIYDRYRKEKGFPTAAEIEATRRVIFGGSITSLALHLKTSESTVKLYERGALPSDEHGEKLKALVDDLNPQRKRDDPKRRKNSDRT